MQQPDPISRAPLPVLRAALFAVVGALLGGRPPLPEETGPSALALVWRERPPPVGAVLADVVVRRGPPPPGRADSRPRQGLTLAN